MSGPLKSIAEVGGFSLRVCSLSEVGRFSLRVCSFVRFPLFEKHFAKVCSNLLRMMYVCILHTLVVHCLFLSLLVLRLGIQDCGLLFEKLFEKVCTILLRRLRIHWLSTVYFFPGVRGHQGGLCQQKLVDDGWADE